MRQWELAIFVQNDDKRQGMVVVNRKSFDCNYLPHREVSERCVLAYHLFPVFLAHRRLDIILSCGSGFSVRFGFSKALRELMVKVLFNEELSFASDMLFVVF